MKIIAQISVENNGITSISIISGLLQSTLSSASFFRSTNLFVGKGFRNGNNPIKYKSTKQKKMFLLASTLISSPGQRIFISDTTPKNDRILILKRGKKVFHFVFLFPYIVLHSFGSNKT